MGRGGQVTTFSFFRFAGHRSKIWAFGQMQFAHHSLSEVRGQSFYKLMGSGRERFSPWPDWSVYTLLQVWQSEEAARQFFRSDRKWHQYKKNSSECWVLFLENKAVKGSWDSKVPFEPLPTTTDDLPYSLVLTRATIRLSQIRRFWRYVPDSQTDLYNQPGLIYTKGVGEWPLRNMATVSIWSDESGIRKFAYRGEGHRKAIELTRKYDWYSEELFSRFRIYAMSGTWESKERSLDLPDLGLL